MDKDKYAIFDLDNCLSDDEHRVQHIDWSKTGNDRWTKYHDMCMLDKVNPQAASLLRMHVAEEHGILFITGRPEAYQSKTVDWISRNFAGLLFSLRMRPNDNVQASAALKADLLRLWLSDRGVHASQVVAAYDDRADILRVYRALGVRKTRQLRCHDLDAFAEKCAGTSACECTACDTQKSWPVQGAKPVAKMVPEILRAAAQTFEERNGTYGSNFEMVPKLVDVLFPDGVPSRLVHDPRWHLFELMLVKLSRFAIQQLSHQDSIRDLTVYAAMVEALIPKEENK